MQPFSYSDRFLSLVYFKKNETHKINLVGMIDLMVVDAESACAQH